MNRLFGTDGIRGVAGKFPLDDATISAIGHSLAERMSEKLVRPAKIVIGRDTRESGSAIMAAFHSGAASAGAVCESAEIITTPGVAYVTRKFDFDAGVVISASHNPYNDNGIKIFAPDGKKIEEAAEKRIEQDIYERQNGIKDVNKSVPGSDRADQFHASYLEDLAGRFPDLSLSGKKLVIDCANGAASDLAAKLFSRFGGDLVVINNKPDGRNINANCGSLHLENLQSAVISNKADFGLALDGDADRALCVDETGSIVDGDATLWILAQYLKSQGKLRNRSVVATVMSNIGLELALKSIDLRLIRTSVGDKYVLEELIVTNSDLGGEQSGHIILPQVSLVGDGMMTALFVLEAMYEQNRTLSQIVRGFTRYPQILVNVNVREKRPFESVAKIIRTAREIESALNGNGRLLLRYSGTENLARVMIEGKEQHDIEARAHRLAEVIREELS